MRKLSRRSVNQDYQPAGNPGLISINAWRIWQRPGVKNSKTMVPKATCPDPSAVFTGLVLMIDLPIFNDEIQFFDLG
jgi:hypothetical protein